MYQCIFRCLQSCLEAASIASIRDRKMGLHPNRRVPKVISPITGQATVPKGRPISRNRDTSQFMVNAANNPSTCRGQSRKLAQLVRLINLADYYRRQMQNILAGPSGNPLQETTKKQEAQIFQNLLDQNIREQAELQERP